MRLFLVLGVALLLPDARADCWINVPFLCHSPSNAPCESFCVESNEGWGCVGLQNARASLWYADAQSTTGSGKQGVTTEFRVECVVNLECDVAWFDTCEGDLVSCSEWNYGSVFSYEFIRHAAGPNCP